MQHLMLAPTCALATTYDWQLVYHTKDAVDTGSEQGMGKAVVDEAWRSCSPHLSAIRYDIAGKPYAYYRRNHEAAADKKFSAFELISDCWKSKQVRVSARVAHLPPS